MKRVLILGSGGAGKSTFARRLHEITELEIIHLDKIYWKPDWTEPSKEEWIKITEKYLEKDAWIIDGNFGSTLKMRLEKCDTVILLDVPPILCVWRVLKRFLIYRGETRPDMGAKCDEKIDLEFLKWIWNFPKKDKLRVTDSIAKHGGQAKIIRLASNRDVEQFFRKIREN